jgi:CRP-like cAMP-binding protein
MEHLTSNALPPPPPRDGEHLFRAYASVRAVPRHTPIYAPGDRATHAYLVEQGEVKLSRCTPDGRELTLAHLGAGEVFGDTEALLGRAHEALALARTDCVLHVLERETLVALAGREPAFALWLTQRLGERQAHMESRLETLLFRSANGKVAEVLLRLAGQHGRATPTGTLIDYPITHQEIGNLIATTRETVSYAFMEFRQRGLISTRRRRTVILDRAALGDVALS